MVIIGGALEWEAGGRRGRFPEKKSEGQRVKSERAGSASLSLFTLHSSPFNR
jgi:hypothetical protein